LYTGKEAVDDKGRIRIDDWNALWCTRKVAKLWLEATTENIPNFRFRRI
jgi:trans-2-enoyl-CoA reductase